MKYKTLRILLILTLLLFVLVSCVPTESEQVFENNETVLPADSTFEIQFIDVGQADAALVLCDGRAMLIDGGNRGDSDVIYTVLKKRDITHLDYMVATHAHEDHIGGLPAALNFATVDTVFSPVTSYESETFRNFVKYVENQNKTITIPSVGDIFDLGSAKFEILAVNTFDETNNTSIVLKITYGDTAFLFTGDAEREVEEVLVNSDFDLSSTVLKVGHHGSESSTSYLFLREAMPVYAVISVGEGNTYGHPTDDTLSRLRDADVQVFRTDLQGDVICVSDGHKVTFTTNKNTAADIFKSPDLNTSNTYIEPVQTSYVLNKNSRKFHSPDCRHIEAIKEENKELYTGSKDSLINLEYSPCKTCNPQ